MTERKGTREKWKKKDHNIQDQTKRKKKREVKKKIFNPYNLYLKSHPLQKSIQYLKMYKALNKFDTDTFKLLTKTFRKFFFNH